MFMLALLWQPGCWADDTGYNLEFTGTIMLRPVMSRFRV
jgi:hypothetical protein